jgi:hypothetical protein
MANTFNPFASNARFTPRASSDSQSIDQIVGPGSGGTPAADYNSLFAGLLELSFKGISFPYAKLHTRLRHDLAIHKFADRDGAHIEGTGRAPLEITARVPLLNGLDAGINETWQRPLYPFVRDLLLAACSDRSSGELQHPELGKTLTCKVQTMEWELEAQVRSGVWVDFAWIETDDSGDSLDQALSVPSPLANAQAAAADLDSNLAGLATIVVPDPYVPPISFSDLVNQIRAVVDLPTELQKSAAGRLDNIVYEANALTFSLNSAVNANALNWPMLQAAQRAKESAYDLKATILQKGKPVKFYVTQKDSTLAQIASTIGANVMDVISLNPAYAISPTVPSGSSVRYYAKAA